MITELNAFQLQFGIMIAERRSCVKVAAGQAPRGIDKRQSNFSLHVHGVLGEIAVAALLGVKIDTSVTVYGDSGHDLVYRGHTIQVKTNSSQGPTLYFYVPEKHKMISDVGILTQPLSMTQMEIVGWITREKFQKLCEPVNFGYRTNYGVPSTQLDAPEHLIHYLDALGEKPVFNNKEETE